jgi:hypothetical protein
MHMRKIRFGLALTSWFRVQEQGMQDYEILSRASAILVKRKSLNVFTSQHVTHPFLWQQYYPRNQYDWLDFVNEHHMKYNLELRDVTNGRLHKSFPLNIEAIHPQKDMALLNIVDEQSFIEYLSSAHTGQSMEDLLLELYPKQVYQQQSVKFTGFELNVNSDNKNDTENEQPLVPKEVSGGVNVYDQRNNRVFAGTIDSSSIVSMGMCGGPCIVSEEGKTYCAGMLEGLVQTVRDPAMEHLRNNAVFIPSTEMIHFLESVTANNNTSNEENNSDEW